MNTATTLPKQLQGPTAYRNGQAVSKPLSLPTHRRRMPQDHSGPDVPGRTGVCVESRRAIAQGAGNFRIGRHGRNYL